MFVHLLAGTLALLITVACGGDTPSPTAPSPPPANPLEGFSLAGDPAAAGGATWNYRARVDGIDYDLQGVLLKPQGTGPHPAVIVSHGAGGNAGTYSLRVARAMVGWDLVVIATNYTHAGGVAIGSPGTASEPGASAANVQRARRLVEILRGLAYVDMSRLALHGHSMGAFVTAATAGAFPELFRVASHTAGGIVPTCPVCATPTESQVAGIRAPYQMHHGDRDFVVPLAADQLFADALRRRGAVHELVVYPGADHDDVSSDPIVLERIRQWYASAGLF